MKLRRFLYILPLFLVTLLATGCSSSDDPTPVPDRPYPPKDVKRTVLVYMVADNSLGSMKCDVADLEEMRQGVENGALGENGRLLIYRNEPGTGAGKQPTLFEMLPGGYSDTLKVYPDDPGVYSVDINRMKEVFADVQKFAPSDSKGLVLWSHGSGWQENKDSRSINYFAFGEDRGQTMKVSSLAQALEGQGLEFIYFDCCFMGSVEVAYELRHCAKWMAASATELPVPGTCYDLNLAEFFRVPEADIVSAARNTFNHYDMLQGMDRTCTMSVIDLTQMDELAAATRKVVEAKFQDFSVTQAGMQKFMRNDRICTLFDMEQYIEALCQDEPEMFDKWKAILGQTVKYAATTPWIFQQLAMNRHCGLGTYILENQAQSTYRGYNNQQWWKDVVSLAPAFNQ